MVKGHSKWEAGENRPERSDSREWGEGAEGERGRGEKTEGKNDRVLQMKRPGEHVSVAKPHICNEKYGAPRHPCTQNWG